ncbi:MAG TPA: hypothetical protein VEF53_18845 [Patescibacteria group bacterium]|nr:hypothetical protein [Patescibacteria group bacterium]
MAQKNIIRKERNRENPYAQIYKRLLNDSSLSYKARGIAAYILSKPDDWSILICDLVNNSVDGEKSVRSGLNELKDKKYLQRYPIYVNGKVDYWESVLSEEPYPNDKIIQCIKIRCTDDGEIISEEIIYKNLHSQNRQVVDTKGIDLRSQNLQVGNLHEGNDSLLINDYTNTDSTNQSISNTEGQTELEEIITNCELEVFKPEFMESIEMAIEQLYFSNTFKCKDIEIPQSIVRKNLKRLNSSIITYAIDKLKNNHAEKVTNSVNYLAVVIYNSIAEYQSHNITNPY